MTQAIRDAVALLPELERYHERQCTADHLLPSQTKTIIAALEAIKKQLEAPDPLGEALNSGDGVYRP